MKQFEDFKNFENFKNIFFLKKIAIFKIKFGSNYFSFKD